MSYNIHMFRRVFNNVFIFELRVHTCIHAYTGYGTCYTSEDDINKYMWTYARRWRRRRKNCMQQLLVLYAHEAGLHALIQKVKTVFKQKKTRNQHIKNMCPVKRHYFPYIYNTFITETDTERFSGKIFTIKPLYNRKWKTIKLFC